MEKIILAVPKGRILEELTPVLEAINIIPEEDFFASSSRKLIFETNHENINIIKIRSFDVATFVAHGAAHIGLCGSDVLLEFGYDNLYTPVDLGIGKCRISVALPDNLGDDFLGQNCSHISVATKYINITKKYFEEKGVQAECVKLNGSIELAPKLGLAQIIVDLVSTGNTLRANNMHEQEVIEEISTKLIVNKNASKTRKNEISKIIDMFTKAYSNL